MSYFVTISDERGVVSRVALPSGRPAGAGDLPPARHLMAIMVRYVPPRLRGRWLARVAAQYVEFAQGAPPPTPRADCLAEVDELLEAIRREPAIAAAARGVC